jgi:hypothetical protein
MGLSVLSELDGAEVRSRAVPTQSFGDMVLQALGKRRANVPRGTRDDAVGAERGVHVDANAERDDAGAVKRDNA